MLSALPHRVRTVLHECLSLLVTFTIALTTGWVFLRLGMPAPFMMGSLFGVWVVAGVIPTLQPHVGVARWFHIPVVLGLGVLIGASFGGGFLDKVVQWWPTVSLMVGTTVLVSVVSYYFLTHYRGYEPKLSYLCCVPGGQAEAIIIARETVEKDYVVALFHLVRVVIVFVSTPAILAFVKGQAAVDKSNVMLQTMPRLSQLPSSDLFAFCALALGGYLIGRLLRLPMSHLLGPMVASAFVHYMGWLQLPRVNEFVILAQLAIGGSVGARLSQVAFSELRGYIGDAMWNSVITLGLFILVALLVSHSFSFEFLPIWMAFVPGGLYEITLLGLVFGFDVAFIAFHHTTRVMLVFFSLPFMITRLK